MRVKVIRSSSVKAKVEIDAGVCGFHATAHASSDDGMFVELAVKSNCEKIARLAATLRSNGLVNAYEEINPGTGSAIMEAARAALPGCCAGCAAPMGIFKAMQVAAGLALAKDVHIAITKEEQE